MIVVYIIELYRLSNTTTETHTQIDTNTQGYT